MFLSRTARLGVAATAVAALAAGGGVAVAASGSAPASGYVFLADEGADASVAAAIAGKVGAPVLLTGKTGLPKASANAIKRLNPKLVVVVGGPKAIHAVVVTRVRKLAPAHRVYGPTAIDTAAALAVYADSLPGTTGGTGPAGTNGSNGANGATILSGTGAPTSALGRDGDYYLAQDTGTLYGPKVLGAWPSQTVTLVGPQGPIGLVGDTGDTGAKGDTGDAGAKGDVGDAGAKGDTGDAGAKGDVGDAGAKGDTGDAGANGAAGSNGATILAGISAPGNNVGSNGDYYLNTTTATLFGPKVANTWPGSGVVLVGPKGDKGDVGNTGDQGAVGQVGDVGPQGPAGALGPKGDVGAKGDKGDAGAAGVKGDKGDTGATGAAGVGGITVSDASSHLLGRVLTMNKTTMTLLTSTGFQVNLNWDGSYVSSQMYWTGANCTSGSAYLNGAGYSTPKVVAFAKTTGTLLIPAVVDGTGLSPAVLSVAVQSIDNDPCGSSVTGKGWLLKTTTTTEIGMPNTITGPLSVS